MILPQQTIRYTTNNLGVVNEPNGEVNAGDLGRYLGPTSDDGWHYTEPSRYPGKIVPVTLAMIEVDDAA